MKPLACLFEMNKHMVPMETLELEHFTAFSGGNKTCFPRFKRGVLFAIQRANGHVCFLLLAAGGS